MTNSDLVGDVSAEWHLTAAEDDMIAAEMKVRMLNRSASNALGYVGWWSKLDWEPMDEDDQRPDKCDRSIRAARPDQMATFFRIAGELGDKGTVTIYIDCAVFSAEVHSNQAASAEIYQNKIDTVLAARVERAAKILTGGDL